MTMLFFWVVTPCALVGSPEDWDSMFLRNIGIYVRVHTASQPKTILFLRFLQKIDKVHGDISVYRCLLFLQKFIPSAVELRRFMWSECMCFKVMRLYRTSNAHLPSYFMKIHWQTGQAGAAIKLWICICIRQVHVRMSAWVLGALTRFLYPHLVPLGEYLKIGHDSLVPSLYVFTITIHYDLPISWYIR
jgi:hypothetical protein